MLTYINKPIVATYPTCRLWL